MGPPTADPLFQADSQELILKSELPFRKGTGVNTAGRLGVSLAARCEHICSMRYSRPGITFMVDWVVVETFAVSLQSPR